MRERVVAEARLAARLTHPHVVGVLDTGEQDGRPFVVMERLSGRTLRDELAGGPMPRRAGPRRRAPGPARARGGPRARDRAPRREAREHPRRRRGDVEGGRLRHREVGPRGRDPHGHRRAPGEPLLPRPRADRRGAGGTGERPLRRRGAALRSRSAAGSRSRGTTRSPSPPRSARARTNRPRRSSPTPTRRSSAVIERAMRRDPAERYESAEAMAAALLGRGAPEETDDVTATIVAPATTALRHRSRAKSPRGPGTRPCACLAMERDGATAGTRRRRRDRTTAAPPVEDRR